MGKILIIEDDPAIAGIERDYLELSDFDAVVAADGETGLALALEGGIDLVLLDLMLPGLDGFSVCRRLRETSDIPILLVTARSEDVDKIRGLGYGADDYVEKPFSPSVLVARVKANLAQYKRLKAVEAPPTGEVTAGTLRIDTDARRVFDGDEELQLKNTEYELLRFLARHPNQVFSREDLYELIWGLESMGDNVTVAVHVNRLREKIEADPSNPQHIQTVWGAGYRFKP
ncbi:MAG: response regulator transcription factor [Oscillospiraceae bacterium]|nr:response regulator transcription factor [Oscillospiraceae bacterium]